MRQGLLSGAPTSRLRRLRSNAHWWLVAAGAVAAALLGWFGLDDYSAGHGVAWPTHLWFTARLFKSSVPVVPRSAPLEIAVWLAPLTAAYAVFRALVDLFGTQWRAFRVRHFASGHVIVCGLGGTGMRVAMGFAAGGSLVVGVEADPSPAATEASREHGVVLLGGDATDPLTLIRAAVQRARYLVIACGVDGTNAAVALGAQALAGRRARPLRCILQVDDDRLCALLEESVMSDPGPRPVSMEFFNVHRAGARALLDAVLVRSAGTSSAADGAPPAVSGQTSTAPDHIIVVGRGPVAAEVASEVARRWMIEPVGSRRLVILAPTAGDLSSTLRSRYAHLDAACELTPHDLDPTAPEADLASIDVTERTVVLVCDEDDGIGLQATLRLRREFPATTPIVLCVTGRSSVDALLRLTSSEMLPNVEIFPVLERSCLPEVVLNGQRELLARTIHAGYVVQERRRGARRDDDVALVPWEQLPEALREANRAQAADIGHKLATVGRKLVAAPSVGAAGAELTPEEVEKLARLEHQRWMDERLAAGWRLGPQRDIEAKTHPSLVPWEELDRHDQDRDREVVLAIPGLLARAGYAIVRDSHRGPAA